MKQFIGVLVGFIRPIPEVYTFVTPVFYDGADGYVTQEVVDDCVVGFQPITFNKEFQPIKFKIAIQDGDVALHGIEMSNVELIIGCASLLGSVLESRLVDKEKYNQAYTNEAIRRFIAAPKGITTIYNSTFPCVVQLLRNAKSVEYKFKCFISTDPLLVREELLTLPSNMPEQGNKEAAVAAAASRQQAIAGAQDALERNALIHYFIPEFSFSSNRIVGVKAIINWVAMGSISDERTSIASCSKKRGLLQQIDYTSLLTVCHWTNSWNASHEEVLNVTVNLYSSGYSSAWDQIISIVVDCLEKSGLTGSHLVLEIPERELFNDINCTKKALIQLQSLGVKITVSEFGSGISSFSDLQSLSINKIAIDSSFSESVENSSAKVVMISAIVKAAHVLGVGVLAAGVSDLEQCKLLRLAGCDSASGPYFSVPLTADEIENFIRGGESSSTKSIA